MSELYHHGVKGQKWGIRKMPNLYPKGPFKNARQRRAMKKTSQIYTDMITKNVDLGGRFANFKYRRYARKIAKSYGDNPWYYSNAFAIGTKAAKRTLKRAKKNGLFIDPQYYSDAMMLGAEIVQQTLNRMGIDEYE